MAVSMIRQKLGNRVFTNYVPAGGEEAKSFADEFLPGEYEILTKVGESGSDSVTEARFYLVMIKNDETHEKTYLSFYAKANTSDVDVKNALTGKTFNNVKADSVYILRSRKVQIASDDG